jgi:UDP-N-acetylmuramate dehydrogenase
MTSLNSHTADLSRFWEGEILWNRPMASYSTFKVGGPAEAIIPVHTVEGLRRLVRWLEENKISWRILGRGSNILVPDHGLPGVTILLEGEFGNVEKLTDRADRLENNYFIRAGGGCPLTKIVRFCTENSLSGLEFAVGIPGSIGGAIVMNAGAWGHEIGNLLDSALLMNSSGKIYTEKRENLGFTYRGWGMAPHTVLLHATLALTAGNRDEIKSACNRFQALRKKNQPLAEPSAGSFFKNPPAMSAGQLIDRAGLKGQAIGGAKVSEKHANFIVNTGEASASDILDLMRLVQNRVFARFGIKLVPEVHILRDGEKEL